MKHDNDACPVCGAPKLAGATVVFFDPKTIEPVPEGTANACSAVTRKCSGCGYVGVFALP